MQHASKGRNPYAHALQFVLDQLEREIKRKGAFEAVDYLIRGETGIYTPPQPENWIPVGSDKMTIPGFILNRESPTADVPFIRGVTTQTTTTQVDDTLRWRRWFGTPKEDANPSFYEWWFTKDIPPFLSLPRGAPGVVIGGTFTDPFTDAPWTDKFQMPRVRVPKAHGVSINFDTRKSTVPTITTYRKRDRQKHKKTGPAVVGQVLMFALEITSEAADYWEVIRETYGIQDHISHRDAFMYLYRGGWKNVDGVELATALTRELVLDYFIGRFLGSWKRDAKSRLGLSHMQIS